MDSIKAPTGRKIPFFLLTIGGPSFPNLSQSLSPIFHRSIHDRLPADSRFRPIEVYFVHSSVEDSLHLTDNSWSNCILCPKYGAADKGPLYGMGSGSWGAFEKSSLMRR
ncbi:uncharacterized protein LOC131249027 isoform X3 [Magnolia sinica]|uniref:uncharacterized protein LOC131249027 isoform X3 n=1 Tax=Magnolia sinica TaxID=86752 RepID=UPI002659D087|nr:uncharacterized protein LOC131249027 isoform X3 [Magnolia sinica]